MSPSKNIGSSRMRAICVSIAEPNVEKCLKALKNIEFAEIRLDRMNVSEEDVKKIFSKKRKTLIATCRPGEKNEKKKTEARSENERKELLLSAINAGAAYVDINVDANDKYRKEIITRAKKNKCKVIVSYHNYKKTPNSAELDQIVKWCFESGADIAKIACKSNSNADNARLLALLDSDKKLIIIGIGKKGRITRIIAPLLGSPFTFASLREGKETASGQFDAEKLKNILDIIKTFERCSEPTKRVIEYVYSF
ncbi:MAG: type I 3-dehydroquinate dehydratase [Candidatus Micrarchaeota archaeon]